MMCSNCKNILVAVLLLQVLCVADKPIKCSSSGQRCYGVKCNTVYRCSNGRTFEKTDFERPNIIYYCKEEPYKFYETKPKKCLSAKERAEKERKNREELQESLRRLEESREIHQLAMEYEKEFAEKEKQRIQREKEEKLNSLEIIINDRKGNVLEGRTADLRDHVSYKTVKIGAQTWLAEDLRYEKQIYGLYDLNTIRLCPSGWHLPTSQEWFDLLFYMFGVENEEQYIEMFNRESLKGLPLINGDAFKFSANNHAYWMYVPEADDFYLVDFDCGAPEGCENNTSVAHEAFCQKGCYPLDESGLTKLPRAGGINSKGYARCVKD